MVAVADPRFVHVTRVVKTHTAAVAGQLTIQVGENREGRERERDQEKGIERASRGGKEGDGKQPDSETSRE